MRKLRLLKVLFIAWSTSLLADGVPQGAPWFAPEHAATLYLALDGDITPRSPQDRVPDKLAISAPTAWVAGYRGQAAKGPFSIHAPMLAENARGSLEFWMQTVNKDNSAAQYTAERGSEAWVKVRKLYVDMVNSQPPAPVALCTLEGGYKAVSDDQARLIKSGEWHHIVMTWSPGECHFYLDGRHFGPLATAFIKNDDATWIDPIVFGKHTICDEVFVYPDALSSVEAANAYWRYLDPAKMQQAGRSRALVLEAYSLPTAQELHYRVNPMIKVPANCTVEIELLQADGKRLADQNFALDKEFHLLKTPLLKDTCSLVARVKDDKGNLVGEDTFTVERKHFPWETMNDLGVSDEVFAPFTPVKAGATEVEVVQRNHIMNSFGLWDKVTARGRPLLAAPMSVRYRLADGRDGVFGKGAVKLQPGAKGTEATYSATVESDELRLTTRSTMEFDGCMKVNMTLEPGFKPATITDLWVDIPMRDNEMPLLHTIRDGLRLNYAGAMPKGPGRIWTSAEVKGSWEGCSWLNDFVGYVWSGGVERGIAWFAANDEGWVTSKREAGKPEPPSVQELVREGDCLILRVHLVNQEWLPSAPRKLLFGLQATPVKPMPANNRTMSHYLPGVGLPVLPWAGTHSAAKYPFNDRWDVVDRIIKIQKGKGEQADRDWFQKLEDDKVMPPGFGNWPFAKMAGHFSGMGHRPVQVYQEELMADGSRPEWAVFQDEWRLAPSINRRVQDPAELFTRGGTSFTVSFPQSYQNYGLYYAQEWLRRGIGLYWDNAFLHCSYHPWMAVGPAQSYRVGENIQPVTTLWTQREYLKRTWNLLNKWRRQQNDPLEFVIHCTDSIIAPWLGFGTVNFTAEMECDWHRYPYPSGVPALDKEDGFPPEYFQVECVGRQIGNPTYLVFKAFQPTCKIPEDPAEPGDLYRSRRDWGMRVVHEVQQSVQNPFSKALFGFGYGTPATTVFNYYDDVKAVMCSDPQVKWLLVTRPESKEAILVLQSWAKKGHQSPVEVRFDPAVIGFTPSPVAWDGETQRNLKFDNGVLTPDLRGGWPMEIIYLSATPRPNGTLLANGFERGIQPFWTQANEEGSLVSETTGKTENSFLRYVKNPSYGWAGPTRFQRIARLDDLRDIRISMRVRAGKVAQGKALRLWTRSVPPKIKPSQSLAERDLQLSLGQTFELALVPATGWQVNRAIRMPQGETAPPDVTINGVAPADTDWHRFEFTMTGNTTVLQVDGVERGRWNDTPVTDNALALHWPESVEALGHVDIDDLTITKAP